MSLIVTREAVVSKYVIAGEHFRYKKDVEARIRAIKDEVPMYRPLDAQDEKFVRAFFAWHPTKAERIAGAVAIHVVRGLCANDRRFAFYLADGTAVDASYRKPLKALTGIDHHRDSVLAAMRDVAHRQAWEWAEHEFGDVAYMGTNHVHHEPPFKELVERFLLQEKASFADITLRDEDGLFGSKLTEDWRVRWEMFHLEHAGYELLDEDDHTERHRVA